jgi:YVTN family beta-propeller protein
VNASTLGNKSRRFYKWNGAMKVRVGGFVSIAACSAYALLLMSCAAAAATDTPVLLILEQYDQLLDVVDPNSLKILARISAGEGPHEVIASPDGKVAYISNYNSFSNPQHILTVVDLVAQKPLPPIDLGALSAPHGLAFVGGKLYFTAEGSKAIGRYDPSTEKVDLILGTGQDRTHMMVVAKDGNQIFTSNVNSNTVSAFRHSISHSDSVGWIEALFFANGDISGWTQVLIPVGAGPEGLDASPDGKELWVLNSRDGTISIIDTAVRKVTQVVNVHTKFLNRLKFTPDGSRVLVSGLEDGDLVVLDVATRHEVKRLNLGHGAAGILMAPDGGHAYVAVQRDNYVAVIELKTLTVTGRIPTGEWPDGMAWAARNL